MATDTITTPTMPAPLLYSIPEFAQAASIGERTVWRWIKGGHLRTVKLSRLVRIPASEVARITTEGIAAPESPVARIGRARR